MRINLGFIIIEFRHFRRRVRVRFIKEIIEQEAHFDREALEMEEQEERENRGMIEEDTIRKEAKGNERNNGKHKRKESQMAT